MGSENIPSSVRVIAIVKNPQNDEDAYTIEFECEVEDSKELINELSKTPLGVRAIALLNQANFMPEQKAKTEEELRGDAEEEEKRIKEREEELREEGRNELREKYVDYIRKKETDKSVEEIKAEVEDEDEKEDEKAKSSPQTDDNNESGINPVRGFPHGFPHLL